MLDVLPDRNKETLIEWLRHSPDGIDLSQLRFAATDLWAHYRAAVQTVFPEVAVVADRFHVVQNLHTAIHNARRDAQSAAANEEERKQLKGLRYLLLKNKHKLTESEKQRLDALAQSHPQLYQIWLLRQELYEWYEIRTSPDAAQITLDLWIEKAQTLRCSHIDSFCKTLSNWKSEILHFFHHRITSGFVEGMNSKIRVLKRIAFGIPNQEHFRLRIIAFCG